MSRVSLRLPRLKAASASSLACLAVFVGILGGTAEAATIRQGDFNSGTFSQWTFAPNVTSGASVSVDSGRVFEGGYSARASVPGGSGNKFARTIWGNSTGTPEALNYGEGADFWYGVAVYLPVGFHSAMQSYFVPMRWDNYGVSNVSRGGLAMYGDGNWRLFRERDGVEGQTNLLGSTTFRLPEGQWHRLEVHQKLSQHDGQALNELFVNGQRVGLSTARNYYGQPVSAMRFGIVAVDAATQTHPLTIWYDRATISSTPTGPVSAPTAPAPVVTGPDTKAPTAPGNLRVTAKSRSSATLAWSPAKDDVAVTKYEVWRGDGGYGNWVMIGRVPASQLSFRDSTVKWRSKYTYGIRAFDAAGNKSASSNVIRVTI